MPSSAKNREGPRRDEYLPHEEYRQETYDDHLKPQPCYAAAMRDKQFAKVMTACGDIDAFTITSIDRQTTSVD